jgi:hypothetical protein
LPAFARALLRQWRGEHGLFAATAVPALVLVFLWIVISWVFDSIDWVWHYQAAAATAILLICLMLTASVWGLIGASRSARRADEAGESAWRVRGSLSMLAAFAIATTGDFALGANIWLSSLWTFANDRDPRADVYVTPKGDRLVISGRFGFGTTQQVAALLAVSPQVRLVELNSPGGIAIEGLAMGKLLSERKVDTVVLKRCASACVTAFAGGERRLLGAHGKLGLHAAGGARRKWKIDVNEAQARFLASRGVARWLIDLERATPNSSIWVPGPVELLESQLVTDIVALGAGPE